MTTPTHQESETAEEFLKRIIPPMTYYPYDYKIINEALKRRDEAKIIEGMELIKEKITGLGYSEYFIPLIQQAITERKDRK